MTLFRSSLLSFSLLTLAACSGGGGGAYLGPSASDSGLVTGTYSNLCWSSGGSYYYNYQVEVGENSVKFTTTTFADQACATAGVAKIASYSSSFPGAATTPSDAQKVDLTVNSITITPLTDNAAALMNSMSECGFTNWAKNVTKIVTTNTSCGLGSQTQAFTVANTSSNTLKLGTSSSGFDGKTEAKRHQVYNSLTYSK